MNIFRLGFIFLFVFLISNLVLAHETGEEHEELNIPENLKKTIDYSNEQANFYFSNVSFLVAFLAGILGILTPCSLAIAPAFFAYSFKEKKTLTKMTLMFFLGFMPICVIFGLAASCLGQTVSSLQQNNKFIVIIAGVLILGFGLMTLLGKGFHGVLIKRKMKKSVSGIFLFGVFFAIGFSACLGPVLFGILLIASILQNYLYAAFLMIFYSLGLFVPLFFISFFFDRYNFAGFINRINEKIGFSITNLIAGLLLVAIGLLFIIYGGTNIFDSLGLGGFTVFIYSLQDELVLLKYVGVVGVIVLVGFFVLLWRFLMRKK